MSSLYSTKTYEPNQNIHITNTEITEIDGQAVKAQACIVLRLFPRPSISIEWEGLPPTLIPQTEQFNISLCDGIPILVRHKHYNIQFYEGGKTRGILTLTKSPSTVFDMKKHLQSVQFNIINFPFNFNKMQLEAGGWLVELISMPNFKKNLEILKADGGYAITHTGYIKNLDGTLLSVDECKQILRGLEWFLSFVRGTNCALTMVRGYDRCGEVSWKRWGTGVVDPWSYERDSWWLNPHLLSKTFSKFWNQLRNDEHNYIKRCLDWYLTSNASNLTHVKIVLNQAALEVLCYRICGSQELPFKAKLRHALEKRHIDREIPPSCQELKKMAENKGHDGPEIFARIRNYLIHSEKREFDIMSSEAYYEAANLGRWYIEVMLLYRFKYDNRYYNLLTGKTELVPWAKGETP